MVENEGKEEKSGKEDGEGLERESIEIKKEKDVIRKRNVE